MKTLTGDAAGLLEELAARDVELWAEGERLRYRAPKGGLTSDLKERIVGHRDELLRLLRQREAARQAPPTAAGLVSHPERLHEPFPLTDIQQAYLVGRSDAFELGTVGCHGYLEVDVEDLDLERFTRAWRRLIDHHAMLRGIILPDGTQRILEQVPPYEIRALDLRQSPPEEAEKALLELREQLSHEVRPVDCWPLFELRATHLANGRSRIHFSIDLLLVDAASILQIFDELEELYADPDRPLVPLEISFRDYVLAEEEHKTSERYQRAKSYWEERLTNLPPAPDLPLARQPLTEAAHRFQRHQGRLEHESWARLKERGGELGLTPSGLLLAAFAEVLASWSRNPAFTINLTFFKRLPVHPQVQQLVGDFTSLVLLEVQRQPGRPFGERAKALQAQLWSDLDHGEFNGVEVMREMARQGRGANQDLMAVVFTSLLTQNTSSRSKPMLGWLGEYVYSISQTPQVLLDHQVYEAEGDLVLSWDVLEAAFPPGLVAELFAAYTRLLSHLAEDPGAWDAAHPVELPPGQRTMRRQVNATEGASPTELLHHPFAASARRWRERPAAIDPQGTCTYGDLDRRSATLARELRARGARPNQLVAVVLEKGWEQIVACLAVLRCGAAYLPVDPHLPEERVHYLLDRGQAALALTSIALDEALAWPTSVERLRVDEEAWDGAEGEPAPPEDAQSLEGAQSLEDLAYVIFTSGSTGQPKGVMIDHRGALNTVLDINERFQIGPQDRVLAISALNFDLSVWDIFGLLAAGGALVFPEPDALRDPGHWLELLERHEVTVWNSVPALVEMLVEHAENLGKPLPPSLRLVMMSGDWIPVTLPDRIRALGEGIKVVSLGGATEASIWSILYPIGEVDAGWKSIPYGKPMRNQTFHVLDGALEPCPVWVPGELFIGGIGVAKGYWRDEERTAAQFIHHPSTGEKLYRTGDLGRYLPDGNIEFLGREDFQVKIRGFRIELGEIESALRQHPAVREAVVAAPGEGTARRLVAYVMTDGTEDPEPPAPAVTADGASGPPPLAELLDFKLDQHGMRSLPDLGSTRALPSPQPAGRLAEEYLLRSSARAFDPSPVRWESLCGLLACVRQIEVDGWPKYRYPSAGHLYPVQLYLYAKPGRVEGLEGGVYYYHPAEHRLCLLAAGELVDREIHAPVNQPAFDGSAFSLFLVARMSAIEPLYGDLARDLTLLEAGYMGQLLMTASADLGLGLCPIGGVRFDLVRAHFDLEDDHRLVHSLVGGAPDLERSRTWPSVPAAPRRRGPQEELRSFLEGKLPEYMVPSAFVLLDKLPLTANGKVDRKALPEPDALPEAGSRGESPLPRTWAEGRLAEIWCRVLGSDSVGVHDDFFESGGDSLRATRFVHQCRTALGLEIPLRTFYSGATVAELGRFMDERLASEHRQTDHEGGGSTVDLAAEVELDPRIRPAGIGKGDIGEGGIPTLRQARTLLLTGATGFLGAYLLRDLLAGTEAEITCLVRAASPEDGLRRLRQRLEAWELWDDAWASRLTAVPGDLARPRLGLDEPTFERLASEMDSIVHNGAVINFSHPYELLKDVNVGGTQAIVELACRSKTKALHYISTVNFFFSPPYLKLEAVSEDDPCTHYDILDVGYAQSKWVAEQIVGLAKSRGLPVAVYRPAMITGDGVRGHSNTDDFFCRFLRGCVELGAAPEINMAVDMVPVSFVSAAVVEIGSRADCFGRTFHLVSPQAPATGDLWEWMRSFGYRLRFLPFDTWRSELMESARSEGDNALYPLLPVFLDGTTTHKLWTSSEGRLRFGDRNTREALAGSPVQPPEADRQLLERYVSYFVEIGYLPPASGPAREASGGDDADPEAE